MLTPKVIEVTRGSGFVRVASIAIVPAPHGAVAIIKSNPQTTGR